MMPQPKYLWLCMIKLRNITIYKDEDKVSLLKHLYVTGKNCVKSELSPEESGVNTVFRIQSLSGEILGYSKASREGNCWNTLSRNIYVPRRLYIASR